MRGRKHRQRVASTLLRGFAVAVLLLLASSAAQAGYPASYPGSYEYFCSWTQGAAKGQAIVGMSTAQATTVSDWRSGTLLTTYPNGSTISKSIQLIRPTTVMGGRGTSWLFRQQNPNVTCNFYVIDNGEELLWENCSNNTTQRCAAVVRRLGQATDPCNCAGLPTWQWTECIKRCMGDQAKEVCTQDLVSAVRCFLNYLQIINSHPNEWGWDIIFGEGRACQESAQCPGGTWCVLGSCQRQGHRETGSPCTQTDQCPSGDVCSVGVCTHERDVRP